MRKESFNEDWFAATKHTAFELIGSQRGEPVTLPYDIIRDLDRSADSVNRSHTGYFPGGFFGYEKDFFVPEEWRNKSVTLEFEGVYCDAMVFINGDFAVQRPNGYSGLKVTADMFLNYGEQNTIVVEARSHLDSRWYSGGGIYRDVWIAVGEIVHIPVNGVRVHTPDIDDERAVVVCETSVRNLSREVRTVRVDTAIVDPTGNTVATGTAPVTVLPNQTGAIQLRLYVDDPFQWSVNEPNLYQAHTTLKQGDEIVDEDTSTFGIRKLQVDPKRGLRINGQPIKLRGGCIHHDNGPIGSAAIPRAEERKVELLKAAGYNAIRSAHNQISRAMLNACDRLGMLVMDELTDMWTQPMTPFDYSLSFPEWWERDIEAMVEKDFNHPSVIFYSIGNEIPELGRPLGSEWGRRLAQKVRREDPTRLVTNCIQGLTALPELAAGLNVEGKEFNEVLMTMLEANHSEGVTVHTEESHAVLDVSGVNYAEGRYEIDRERFPNRILVGSETFPPHLDELWRLVTENPTVIGDFAWTGFEYMGEAGIGYNYRRGTPTTGISAPYPALIANVGTIDLTGYRRPISYWREIVWGLRSEPYIAVQNPELHGVDMVIGPWSWPDALSSWSWGVKPGSPVTVDVYSDADEVELLVNGESVGRQRVGTSKAFIASFETTYQPGVLEAVAITGGSPVSRSTLNSASGTLSLTATADRTEIASSTSDLAYVDIVIRDDNGVLANHEEQDITVTVSGAGKLLGLCTAKKDPEGRFDASTITTYEGRALAVIRPTGAGDIVVTVAAENWADAVEVVRAR